MSTHKLLFLIVVVTLAGFIQPGFASAVNRDLPNVDESLYSVTPEPLTPAECARCHNSQFASLKVAGGKHRFDCQECHEVIHAYSPRKNNYDAIMPVCATCHDQPHGPTKTDCLGCHQNPHAPRNVPAMEKLGKACADCHKSPAAELQKYPSAHTEQGCQTCHHEKHGYIPNCFECHEGHFEEQAVDVCMTCHDRVHAPLQIGFSRQDDLRTCSGCHDGVYTKWQGTRSKHGKVACTMCHQQHGKIPDCRECHSEPHNKAQHEMFPNCLTCHIDVHDLPIKKK